MTTTATAPTAIELAGAFVSRGMSDVAKGNAMQAARILANAELPDAVRELAIKVNHSTIARDQINLGDFTADIADTMARVRDRLDDTVRTAIECLLIVALGKQSRISAIAPIDYPALYAIVAARY